ncbi:MAG: hypothetical protein AB1393_04725 [Candidatus Edwardsbacteria bacterium]
MHYIIGYYRRIRRFLVVNLLLHRFSRILISLIRQIRGFKNYSIS